MENHTGRNDTEKLPKPPNQVNHPHGTAQAPHTAIRRASMTGGIPEKKQMPTRRPPKQTPEQPASKKSRRKRARTGMRWPLRILIAFAVLILAAFSVFSGFAAAAFAKMRDLPADSRNLNPGAAADMNDLRNILLIGTDSRDGTGGAAESVIMLTISSRNRTVTATSLLRDCNVSIPQHGTDRLDAAFAFGGATLLMDTVANNFGIRADSYIVYGTDAVIAMCDAVGGVEAEITAHEAEAINDQLRYKINADTGESANADVLPGAGSYKLNGKQALCYARIHYDGNADFSRSVHQLSVAQAVLNGLTGACIRHYGTVSGKALPAAGTNMSGAALYRLALCMPYYQLRYQAGTLRLPADGTYFDQTTADGTQVLAVDFDENLRIFEETVTD